MFSLLKREMTVATKSLLVSILIFFAAIIYGIYDVIVNNGNQIQFFAIWFALLIAMNMETRPMIQDDKDEVCKYLKMLPINVNKIVSAKFIFVNSVFVIFDVIASSYLFALSSCFPTIISISINSILFSTATSFIIINLFLLGYYIFGAANLQYVILGVCLGTFCLFKYLSPLLTMPYSLIIFILTIPTCVVFYVISCKVLKKAKN